MTPSGVHGTRPGRPCDSRPAFTGVSPSTSLAGRIAPVMAPESMWSGSGSWSRIPLTSGSPFSRSSSGLELVLRRLRRQLVVDRDDAHLLARLALHPHIDVRGGVVAHEHGRESRRDAPRPQLGHLGGHPLAHLRGHGLAVDDRALGHLQRLLSGA